MFTYFSITHSYYKFVWLHLLAPLSQVPKDPALGASVFKQVLFGELGEGRTGCFFKEASKAGTPLEDAVSKVDPWLQ